MTVDGAVVPNTNTGLAYRWFMTQGYPRIKEVIEQDKATTDYYQTQFAPQDEAESPVPLLA